jgi:hypothetical protein
MPVVPSQTKKSVTRLTASDAIQKAAGNRGMGRPKGSVNKRTREVQEQMERLGGNCFAFLIATMMDDRKALGLPAGKNAPRLDFKYRVDAAKELCHYIAPKRKSIDITSEGKSMEDTFAAAVGMMDSLNKGSKK